VKPGGVAIFVLGTTLASACSATDVARPAAAREAGGLAELLTSLSGRCPGFERTGEAAATADDQLFVELVILDVPTALAERASISTLRDLSRSEQVGLLGSPHVIGKWDQLVEMGPGSDRATSHGAALTRWSIRPRRAEEDVAVLELQMQLAGAGEKTRDVAFTATARPNEPSLAHVVWDHASTRSLLVLLRVFEVHGEPELRAIFECKMQEHQRARRQRATGPDGR
jgi:hypothetical protein